MPEKQVVFYPTYAYKVGDSWEIPMKLWVKKDANKVRRIAARAARKVVKNIVGIDDLTDEQKQIFMFRAEDFVADSKSGESPEFRFNNDPDNATYRLINTVGKSKTDRNGLLEGSITLTNDKVHRLLEAQQSVGGSGQATVAQKSSQIETLLSHFPERKFILIGDSGEHDPEIFKVLQTQHPKQVAEIRIRDVVDARNNAPDRLQDMTVIALARQDESCR